MNWFDLSELNFGLIIDERNPSSMYKPEWFASPFDKGVDILLKKGATKEDVAKVLSSSYMNDAHDSVKRMNGLGESVDWVKALITSYENDRLGKKLQKIGKKLEQNEDVDKLQLYGELSSSLANESNGLQPIEEISDDYIPFEKCGLRAIDNTLGGIPTDGPIIVLGTTGTGKSKFAALIIGALLELYPEKKAAIYTLEMPAKHWKWRSFQLVPSLKKINNKRLFVSGSVRNVEELVAEITAKRVNYVVIDDIDNLVTSNDPSEYERVYRRIKEICRFMSIPVFVLCQPNRIAKQAVKNGERFLGLYDSSWSGASENSAALFIALQTVHGLDMKSEEFPTAEEKLDYLIFWKSRDGWPADRDPKAQRGPGAVIMKHSANWNGEPYGGTWRIWEPDSGGRAIGTKKSNKKKSEE